MRAHKSRVHCTGDSVPSGQLCWSPACHVCSQEILLATSVTLTYLDSSCKMHDGRPLVGESVNTQPRDLTCKVGRGLEGGFPMSDDEFKECPCHTLLFCGIVLLCHMSFSRYKPPTRCYKYWSYIFLMSISFMLHVYFEKQSCRHFR